MEAWRSKYSLAGLVSFLPSCVSSSDYERESVKVNDRRLVGFCTSSATIGVIDGSLSKFETCQNVVAVITCRCSTQQIIDQNEFEGIVAKQDHI
jgi:hypothetical protein